MIITVTTPPLPKQMAGWMDYNWDKFHDPFVRAMQERVEDGYWLLRETKLDNIDRDAKVLFYAMQEQLKRVS